MRELLAVEQDEQSADARVDADALIVEEQFDERPVLVVCALRGRCCGVVGW